MQSTKDDELGGTKQVAVAAYVARSAFGTSLHTIYIDRARLT